MARLDELSTTTRLTEFLAADYGKLQLYLGAAAFAAVGRRFAKEYPQLDPSVRWFSQNLPKFLSETIPYARNPELAELANLEAALNAAFEAQDAPLVSVTDLAKFESRDFADFGVAVHPSVKRLCFSMNATSIWAALQCDEVPPRPERLDLPQELLVWRQGTNPRFRMLGQGEAKALDLAIAGTPFSKICESLENPDTMLSQTDCAQTYLRGWVEAELISALRNMNEVGEK